MKKALLLLLSRLRTACVFFTCIVILITAVAQLSNKPVSFIASDRLVILFLFSLSLSFINLFFRIKSLGTQIKLLLHWVMTCAALCGLFYFNNMLSNAEQPPSVFIAVLCVTAIAYALGDGAYLLYRVIRPTKGDDDYDPMFHKN